jgi:hypothetical protein
MRHFATVIVLLLACRVLISCSKNSSAPSKVAAVTVVNANVGSQGIIPNLWASTPGLNYPFTYTNDGDYISFGSVWEYSIIAGKSLISFVQVTDTTAPFFSETIDFKVQDIYTLFVAGNTTNPDTLFVQDIIPHLPYADSSAGLRFVNLVQGGSITVDIQGATGNVASGLGYKGIVGFTQFSANSAEQAAGYTFEFRDTESDSLLTTLQVTIMPNLCQTLIFAGSGGSGYLAFTENNF